MKSINFLTFLLIFCTQPIFLAQKVYYFRDLPGKLKLIDVKQENTKWKELKSDVLNIGFVKNDAIWIKIEKIQKNKLLTIPNAAIDSITFISGKTQITCGDRVYNPNYNNPIAIFSSYDSIFYLRIKKEYSSLVIPVEFKDKTIYPSIQARYNLMDVLLLGIFLAFLVFSLAISLYGRAKSFLFFGFYIITTILFYYTSNGLLKTVFFPKFLYFSEVRLYVSCIAPITLFWFNTSLIRYNTLFIKRFTNLLVIGIFSLTIVSIFFFRVIKDNYVKEYVLTIYLACFLLVIILFYMNIRELSLPKKASSKRFAYLFLGSISITILLFVLEYLQLEWLPDFDYFLLITCMEVVVFGIFISIDFFSKFKLNEQLAIDSLESKKRAMEELKTIQFKERKNIAAILHNRYQSKLTGFRLHYSNLSNSDEKIINEVKNLEEEIRDFSHQILPRELENGLFHDAVIRHLDFLKTVYPNWAISYNVFDDEENAKNKWSYDLYLIVSELLQNSLKHSMGREIQIEFYRHEKECILTYSDFGQSINSFELTNGFGTSLIKDQVEHMGAKFQFELTPNLLIIISIPN